VAQLTRISNKDHQENFKKGPRGIEEQITSAVLGLSMAEFLVFFEQVPVQFRMKIQQKTKEFSLYSIHDSLSSALKHLLCILAVNA
jgi:hypothetical protein